MILSCRFCYQFVNKLVTPVSYHVPRLSQCPYFDRQAKLMLYDRLFRLYCLHAALMERPYV
jgi:hypothetical protein